VLIECKNCQKRYNIPDEKIASLCKRVVLPCPVCKEKIEIIPENIGNQEAEIPAEDQSFSGLPTGENLKKKILSSIKDLPPMPQVAQKAREIVSDPDSDFKDLAKVIETDPAIVSKILKISNSAYYGSVGMVASVQQAAVLLGVKTLQELLTIACAAGLLSGELEGYDLEAGEMWKHSLAVAAASRIIALKDHPALAEDAFSAGLIHDAGKLILSPYVNERKDVFLMLMEPEDVSFLSAECKILGFDHAEIASDVCEKWQIPKHISTAIRYHHYPESSNGNGLAYILHVADAVAMQSGIGGGVDGMLYSIDAASLDFLNIDVGYAEGIMEQVVDYVEKTTSEA
jgi:HD-like signal output (HDOD) protein